MYQAGLNSTQQELFGNLSFEAKAGTLNLLVGPRFAGKTTLLQILGGVLKASEGTVFVNGLELNENRALIRKAVGWLVAEPKFYEHFSLNEQLRYVANLQGLDRSIAKSRIHELLQHWQLEEQAGQRIGRLSRESRLRLAIAQAAVANPQVWLLDEPLRGWQRQEAQPIFQLIEEELAKENTIVMATKHLDWLEQFKPQIIELGE